MTAGTTISKPRQSRTAHVGLVTSDGRDKTIKVSVGFTVMHSKYGKYLNRATVLHVHDEKNEAKVGDTVEIAECRPISKTKSWRLVKIVTKAPGGAGA